MLIMTILILFVAILFISATIGSIVCLNKLKMNENSMMKEDIAIFSLINCFDYTSMFGNKKGNLRGPMNLSINNENVIGHVYFGYLSPSLQFKKYLVLDSEIVDSNNRAKNNKKSFKPIPTFTYSHFIINPNDNLGNVNIREYCSGIIRSNKQNNVFTNIFGSAIQESGKPYIYMQDIFVDDYKGLANNYGFYISNSSDLILNFYNNQLLINPVNFLYNLTDKYILAIKNNGYTIRMVGLDSAAQNYSKIQVDHNLMIITDSPVVIESDIQGNGSLMIVSTYKDNSNICSINMDIDAYIHHSLFPDSIHENINSIYYGNLPVYNDIYLKSIFIATNGSFGFLEKTVNNHVLNRYNILGGLIEYNINYNMKHFDNITDPYYHLSIIRDETFLNISYNDEFPFISPPVSKNIFTFDSKYF